MVLSADAYCVRSVAAFVILKVEGIGKAISSIAYALFAHSEGWVLMMLE
jgi:hypothetical protein